MAANIAYVALGDSYTVGTAVEPVASWPTQLVDRVCGRGIPLELVANLAVNGYTSGDVIAHELPKLPRTSLGLASLAVGVNDVVRGVAPDRYAANLEVIIGRLLERVPARRIVTLSTPDYTVTPAGADYGDPATQSAAIRAFNAILARVSAAAGVAHVDIHDLSLRAATDPGLVASDGLHPSGIQYALWVERIEPVVVGLLADPAGPG